MNRDSDSTDLTQYEEEELGEEQTQRQRGLRVHALLESTFRARQPWTQPQMQPRTQPRPELTSDAAFHADKSGSDSRPTSATVEPTQPAPPALEGGV